MEERLSRNFCFCDKTPWAKQLGGKGVYFLSGHSDHWGNLGQELGTRTWRQELKQNHGWMLLTSLLLRACTDLPSDTLQDHLLRGGPHPQWAILPYQSLIIKISTNFPAGNLRKGFFSTESSCLFPMTLAYVTLTRGQVCWLVFIPMFSPNIPCFSMLIPVCLHVCSSCTGHLFISSIWSQQKHVLKI